MKKVWSILLALTLVLSMCGTVLAEDITIEFVQWWEPELPEGSFRQIMDEFEAQNPGIKVKLISNPFASTHDQVVSGAAAGTLSDVVGLDGAWVADLVKQGAILPMNSFMEADANFSAEDIAASVTIDGETYMMAIATFTYHLFANTDILEAAGVETMPEDWTSFVEACEKVLAAEGDAHAFNFPFSSLYASAGQDQFMTWVWATGGRMLDGEGKPAIADNETMKAVLTFLKEAYDAELMSPGVFSKQSQDMFEEFASGRSAFMVNGLSAIASLHERNADLSFDLIPIPHQDGFDGTSGVMYAPWGVGVSASSAHPEEAWKLVSYLMSPEVNSQIAEIANSLPGNKQATSGSTDEAFLSGYAIFQESDLVNEFIGMPSALELNRVLMEQVQFLLEGNQAEEETLNNIQYEWDMELGY